MPAGAVPFPFGSCHICQDRATGVHYGVATCEGCKGFFKRSTTRGEKYKCFFGGQCDLTPQTRNRCKSCRYKRCLDKGMSVEAVKMGRIPKVEKEKALEAAHASTKNHTAEGVPVTNMIYPPYQRLFRPLDGSEQDSSDLSEQSGSSSISQNQDLCCSNSSEHSLKINLSSGESTTGSFVNSEDFGSQNAQRKDLSLSENPLEEDSGSGRKSHHYTSGMIQMLIDKLMENPPLDQWIEQNMQPFNKNVPAIGESSFSGDFDKRLQQQIKKPKMEHHTESFVCYEGKVTAKNRDVDMQWSHCDSFPVQNLQTDSKNRIGDFQNLQTDSKNELRHYGKDITTSCKNKSLGLSRCQVPECNAQEKRPLPRESIFQENLDKSGNTPFCSAFKSDNVFENINRGYCYRESEGHEFVNVQSPSLVTFDESRGNHSPSLVTFDGPRVSHSPSLITFDGSRASHSPSLVTFDGSRASPESAHLIEQTRKRLQKPVEMLSNIVNEKREILRKHLSKEIVLPSTYDDLFSIEEVFKMVVEDMVITNQQIIAFCDEVPGFKNLCQEDKTELLKRSFLDIWVVTLVSPFFYNGESSMVLFNKVLYHRKSIEYFITNHNLVDDLFKYVDKLNSFKLTYMELVIISIVQLTSTDNVILKDKEATQQLNSHFLDILANQIQENHGTKAGRLLIDIFRLLPSLEKLTQDIACNILPNMESNKESLTGQPPEQNQGQLTGLTPGGDEQNQGQLTRLTPGGDEQNQGQLTGLTPGGDEQNQGQITGQPPGGDEHNQGQLTRLTIGGDEQNQGQLTGPPSGGDEQNQGQLTREPPGGDELNQGQLTGPPSVGDEQNQGQLICLITTKPNTG